MKLQNPNQFALFIAACVTFIALLLWGVFAWHYGTNLPIWSLFIIMALLFGFSFGVIWWAIEKFLNEKIKMLYRSIQHPSVMEGNTGKNSNSNDIIGAVQRDVEAWASVKQEEIKTLKEQAKFRRDFIGNLAHELKTPIFNMQGYLLTLIEGGLGEIR